MADAEERGEDPSRISTGIELIEDAVGDAVPIIAEPTTVPIETGAQETAPGPSTTYESISRDAIVGEPWDENTPGAGGDPSSAEIGDVPEAPDTN